MTKERTPSASTRPASGGGTLASPALPDRSSGPEFPVQVELALTAPFRLGPLRIEPALREVSGPAGRLSAEPRALQVLVALHEARGGVLSRDVLVARCWGGRVIGEDAIQRVIAKARRLARLSDPPAFSIENVARVGYRLSPGAAGSEPASDDEPRVGPPVDRARERHPARATIRAARRLWPWLLVVAAVGLAATFVRPLRLGQAPQAPPVLDRVTLTPLETAPGDAAGRRFADALHDRIEDAAGQLQISVGSAPTARGAVEDGLRLGGALASQGPDLEVRLALEDVRDRVVVWSDRFTGPARRREALLARVTAHVADALTWCDQARQGRVRLTGAALKDFVSARVWLTSLQGGNDQGALVFARRLIMEAPDFSYGRSTAAAALAFMALDGGPEQAARRRGAQAEAERALQLDPRNGEAYLALELLAPRRDWLKRDALLTRGAELDPGFEPVALMKGRLLWDAGQGREATDWLLRAHSTGRLHNSATFSLALNEAMEGFAADSQALVTQMETEWPEHPATRDARFWVALASGRTGAALTALQRPDTRPTYMGQDEADIWREALTLHPGDPGAPRLAARIKAAAGSLTPGPAVVLLTMIGDLDDAFTQARAYQSNNPYEPPYLFLPQTAPLRRDPRFIGIARGLGFVDYWRATRPPDFCADGGLRYSCPAAFRP